MWAPSTALFYQILRKLDAVESYFDALILDNVSRIQPQLQHALLGKNFQKAV